jgi:hypothetical protein
MPLRQDEIKEVQEIALIAAKTASTIAYSQVIEKIALVEARLKEIEKQYVAPTKQGKKEK